MSMQWQTVGLPLVGGVDTKTDEKSVLPTKLTLLENGEFVKASSVRKRLGYSLVEPKLTDATAISGLRNLFSRTTELVSASGTNLYSFDSLSSAWVDTGAYCPTTHTATESAYTTSNQTMADMATTNDVTVYAWLDSRGGVRCSVYNDATGAPYSADFSVQAANATRPKCVAIDANILVVYADTSMNALKALVVRTNDITTSIGESPVVVVNDLASSCLYDVVAGSSTAYLLYATDTTVVAGDRACKVNAGGVASSFLNVGSGPSTRLAIHYETSDSRVRFVGWLASTLTWNIYESNLSTLVTGGSYAASDVTNLAIAPNTTAGVLVYRERTPGGTANSNVFVEVEGHGNALATVTLRHVGLGSSAWYDGTNQFVLLNHDSRTGIQSSFYLLRGQESIVGRVLSGEGPGILSDKHLPRVWDSQVALQFRRQLEIQNTSNGPVPDFAVFAHRGIMRVVFDESATPRGVTLGTVCYLTGSQLWAYDGVTAFEQGFHMFPDMLGTGTLPVGDFAHNGTVDASIGNGVTYNYRVYYEWYTATGERFRSAAITRSVTTSAGEQIRLTIPTLRMTLKTGDRTPIQIVIYRSEANDANLYYRVSSTNPVDVGVNGHLYNDTTADTVTFDDGMGDSDLIQQEPDYVTKGELSHFAPEGPVYVAAVQNRLWLIGGGQHPNNIRFSLLHESGSPVEFNGALQISDAPAYGGDNVAISYVNNVPIVFKERATYGLEGEGPDNTGQNGIYVVAPISSDTGCSDPGSVLPVTEGVFFKCAEGIYVLGQNLTPDYVGAEVEAYNEQTCTAATYIPNTNQIIFLMEDGNSLMYDTFYKQWSVYTNHLGVGAETFNGTEYVYLRGDSSLYRRTADVYLDAGVAYKLKIRTAPIRLKDILQGFWRARRLSVLGEYKSSHRLQVGIYYDRDEAPYEVFIFEPDTVLDLDTWGDLSVWGAVGSVWGGAAGGRDYQFQHRFKRQKCQTLRLEFEDLSTGVPPGAAFELNEVALEVGLRDGLGRIPATRKL